MRTNHVYRSSFNFWIYAAAVLSAIAGIIHVSVTPDHFKEWIGYGVFFAFASACQLLLALILSVSRPLRREVFWAGMLGNLAIITMWIVTRTAGVPFGPMAGETENIGVLDLASKIAELALMLCLFGAFRNQMNSVDRLGAGK